MTPTADPPATDSSATDSPAPDSTVGPPRPSTSLAALAGLLSAALALGVTELVSGLDAGTPGPIASVGRIVVEEAPGSLERWAIDTFGTGDKPALLASIVFVCLLLGYGLGAATARRRLAGPIGFAAFAAAGALAALDDPLVSDGLAVAAPLSAAIVGGGVLWLLVGRLATLAAATDAAAARSHVADDGAPSSIVIESPTDPLASRRAFFGYAGGAAAAALTTAGAGRALRGRSNVEAARSEVVLPQGAGQISAMPDARFDTVSGLTSHITDNDDFYLIDTALVKPQVDPDDWTLRIDGMVDDELELTLDDLLAMELVDEEITIACVSNEVGDDLIGNAVWTGVPLLGLLEQAGIDPEATQVAGRSVDGWTCGFPTDLLRDGRPALLAVGMNGEPLPIAHGFPARVIVGGIYGYVSATKWVESLTLTRWEDFDGFWIPRGWSKEGPIKTQCRIDVPRRGPELRPGPAPIAGVAWAPTRGIARVEVQIDDGEWVDATLSTVGTDLTWRQWVVEWDAKPGEHRIAARATDGEGETQTAAIAPPAPNGATGYPMRTVTVVSG